jgi:RHS repeat-associated protein
MNRLLLSLSLLVSLPAFAQYPSASSVEISGGASQRSLITSVSAVFSGDVAASLKPTDLVLRNLTASLNIPPEIQLLTWDPALLKATWTFPTIANQALPQGNYIGWIKTPFTVPNGGLACLANSPLPPDLVFGFHAYFGDIDGDRDVDFLDTCFLRDTWDLAATASAFNNAFDFNLDGTVNASDGPIFQANYFTTFPPAVGVHAQLKNDTGLSPRDGLTFDPSIRGVLLQPELAIGFRGRFENGSAAFTDLKSLVAIDGSFELNSAKLNEIQGATLGFTDHLLQLEAMDNAGAVIAAYDVPFKLHSGANCPPVITSTPVVATTPITNAVLPGTELINNQTLGFYNDQLGTILNGTEPWFPASSDPSLDFITPPDLSRANTILGDWLEPVPDLSNGFWSSSPISLPFSWSVNSESAIVYEINATKAVLDVVARFGVDNGIFVWLDGRFVAGALRGGGTFAGEHQWRLGDLGPGNHYLQVLREDHGSTNGYAVSVITNGGTSYFYDVEATDPDGDSLSYTLIQSPAGMTISQTTGEIRWLPTSMEVGEHQVAVVVSDGRGGTDTQRFTISVLSFDGPPSIAIYAPLSESLRAGEPFAVQITAMDDIGVASLSLELDGARVPLDANGIASLTLPREGRYVIEATVVDSGGNSGFASTSFVIGAPLGTNETDDICKEIKSLTGGHGPRVEIHSPTTDQNLTTDTLVRATIDSLSHNMRDWTVALLPSADFTIARIGDAFPTAIILGQGAQEVIRGTVATILPAQVAAGSYFLRIHARNSDGSEMFCGHFIGVNATVPQDTPLVQITSPAPESCVSYLTPITGSITSTSNTLHSWRVEYARASEVDLANTGANGPDWKLIASGTQPVVNGTLAVFDPTMLPNDPYVIRVVAYNRNGKGWAEPLPLSICGQAKLGNFRLDFTDLQVPLVGIPITITRTYDTLDAGEQGDFGYGWKMGLQDGDIRETTPGSGGIFTDNPYKQGTRVYITTPEGRRVGFTFEAQSVSGSIFGTAYRATFKPDPGVYERLEVPEGDSAFLTLQRDGTVGLFLFGFGWNPDTFILSGQNGTRYTYNQSTGLQNARDLNGNTVTWTPDGVRHSSGVTIPFIRDARGRITEIRDPAGKVIKYTYDAAGDLRTVTDRTGLVTTYDYRSLPAHYLDKVTDPLGRQAVRTEYGPDGRIVAVIDALGNRVQQNFDPANFTGTRTDARGNQTVLVYNDRGNVLEERDPEGGVKKFEYADPANPDKETAIVDPLGRRTGLAYDARGNLTRQTDPNGKTTAVTYTALNKPASVSNALGQRVSLRYDAKGHLDEVIDNAGNKRQMVRDAQGRVTSIMDAEGHVTRFDYTTGCPCGRPGKMIHPDGSFRHYEYNAFGQVTKETDETGVVTRSEYDAEGRLKYTEDAAGHRTTYTYRGTLQETVTNPLGHVTRTEYDDNNRPIKITDAEGGIVRFEYDADGNRTKVIDSVGNVTMFVYDKLGRLNEEINTLGHKRVHSYDSVGNRTETIDRNGRRRTFEFDALNRMTQEKWWDNTNAVIRTLEYAFNDLGLQTRAEDPAARYNYVYDGLNRLRTVQSTVSDLPDFTLTYAYDKNGQTTSVSDNYGISVGSGYDSRNRLHSRTWQGPGINPARVDFDYDKAGRRTRLDRFNNLTGTQRVGFTTIGYDNGGVVADITHRGPAQQVQARHEYKFDSAYQMKSWTINNESSAFEYDRTGQLTNTLGAVRVTESFRYDSNGSRMDLQSDGMYSVKGNNLIASDGPNRYDYDREGNMTSRVNTSSGILTTYQWDHRNRLTAVVDIDSEESINQTVAFVYDAVNRRLAKTVTSPDGTYDSKFLYNQEDAWADLDGAHTITARYLHGPQIDELISRQLRTDGNAWYLTDHLGTVRNIAKDDGVVAAHAEYSSFGNVLSTSDPFLMGRFGFAGREWDAESGLLQMRSRYYNPQMGRFVSEDPIGFKSGDINLLRYVGNSPVNSRDPYGLSAMLSYSLGVKDVLSGGPSTSINNYAPPGAMVGLVHGYGLTSIVFMSEFLRDGNIRDAIVRTELQMTAIKEEACDSAKRLGGGPKFQQGKVGGFVGGFCTGIERTLSIKLFGHELLPEDVGYGGFDQGVSLGLKYLRGVFGQGK